MLHWGGVCLCTAVEFCSGDVCRRHRKGDQDRTIRIAGNSHFSLFIGFMVQNSLYMLYLSGFFIQCLLEKVRVIWWLGRWHRRLEGCGVVGWCDAHGVWGAVGWVLSCFLSMSVFCYPIIGWCLWETSSEEEWLIACWCLLGRIREPREGQEGTGWEAGPQRQGRGREMVGAAEPAGFSSLGCISIEVQLGNKTHCYISEKHCSR